MHKSAVISIKYGMIVQFVEMQFAQWKNAENEFLCDSLQEISIFFGLFCIWRGIHLPAPRRWISHLSKNFFGGKNDGPNERTMEWAENAQTTEMHFLLPRFFLLHSFRSFQF